MTEMVKTTMCGVTYEEPETDLWYRIAHEAMGERYIGHETAFTLADSLLCAVDRIREHEAAVAEMTEPQCEQLELAELRNQLAVMTRREKRWRESALEHSSRAAQASVASFSDFCDGHKSGMRKAREIRNG